jgi:hypothetical protein
LIFFLHLILNTLIFGQEDYRIEESGRFVQILRWQAEEDVLYYEVEIEEQNWPFWEESIRAETEKEYVEVSLPPGIYRYRVRVYDLLGRQGTAADWMQFQVYLAKQPEIERFSPAAFYLDEDQNWTLNLSGRNLTDGIEIILQNQGRGDDIRVETIIAEQSEQRVQALFRFEQLNEGQYTIYAINPGGLAASLGTFRITYRKPVDINFSVGYRPLFPLYGLINDLFETGIFPLGYYMRLSVIPFKYKWGYIGFELEPSWNDFQTKNDNYEVQAQMLGLAISGIYRRWFSNQAVLLNHRLGGGFYPVIDYHFIYAVGNTEPKTILIPVVSVGLSLQWYIRKSFFVEAGMNFIHMFTVDNPSPGYLVPFIGSGIQF